MSTSKVQFTVQYQSGNGRVSLEMCETFTAAHYGGIRAAQHAAVTFAGRIARDGTEGVEVYRRETPYAEGESVVVS